MRVLYPLVLSSMSLAAYTETDTEGRAPSSPSKMERGERHSPGQHRCEEHIITAVDKSIRLFWRCVLPCVVVERRAHQEK